MVTVWQFRWMIMVNPTVANIEIKKQVLMKRKDASDVDKTYSLMKIICQSRENASLSIQVQANPINAIWHRVGSVNSTVECGRAK
jgi:hypothetical protein